MLWPERHSLFVICQLRLVHSLQWWRLCPPITSQLMQVRPRPHVWRASLLRRPAGLLVVQHESFLPCHRTRNRWTLCVCSSIPQWVPLAEFLRRLRVLRRNVTQRLVGPYESEHIFHFPLRSQCLIRAVIMQYSVVPAQGRSRCRCLLRSPPHPELREEESHR